MILFSHETFQRHRDLLISISMQLLFMIILSAKNKNKKKAIHLRKDININYVETSQFNTIFIMYHLFPMFP